MIPIYDVKQFNEARKALEEHAKFNLCGTDYYVSEVKFDFAQREGYFAIMPIVTLAEPEKDTALRDAVLNNLD